MKKSIYFNNCIREIRQTVYGRDMRKPIADAIEEVKRSGAEVTVKRLSRAETELNTDVVDWIEQRPRTVYVNYSANNESTEGLSLSAISSNDYLLTDTKIYDWIELLNDEDYALHLSGSGWAEDALNDESYIVYDSIPHYETYLLVLRIVGGQQGGV